MQPLEVAGSEESFRRYVPVFDVGGKHGQVVGIGYRESRATFGSRRANSSERMP